MVDLSGFDLSFEVPSNNSLVLAIVSTILMAFTEIERLNIHISQYVSTKASEWEQNDIIRDVLVKFSSEESVGISLETHRSFIGEDDTDKRPSQHKSAVLFLNSLISLEHLKAHFLNNHYIHNGLFCIIYTGKETDRIPIYRSIFRNLFKMFVFNANIFSEIEEMVSVYTYFPYYYKYCSNTEPVLYDVFGPSTNYTFRQRKFFSNKLLNMWGCTVRVTTWDKPPFTMVKYNESNGEFDRLEGIEGKLIMLLAERINFTIKIVEEDVGKRIYYYRPGKPFMKSMLDNGTDIAVASLIYDEGRIAFSTPSYVYITLPITLAIPKGDQLTPLERLYRPFKYIIWICLGSSIMFGVLIIIILKGLFNTRVQEFVFGRGNRIPLTNFWNTFYGGPIACGIPRRNFARYLLGMWLIYTWIMRSVYNVQLFHLLQDSRTRTTITTIEEILKRNFTFYVFPILVPSLQISASKDIHIEFFDYGSNSVSTLLQRLGEDDLPNSALTIYYHTALFYNQNSTNVDRRVNILHEPLFRIPITFYMRKNSYLASRINEMILRAMSAGLVKNLEDLYLSKQEYTENKEDAPITLWLLQGLFSMYLCLLLLTSLVFLLELWSKHSRLTKRILDFLNL